MHRQGSPGWHVPSCGRELRRCLEVQGSNAEENSGLRAQLAQARA